jgi:predicted GNAT superfamily acetyltransferase
MSTARSLASAAERDAAVRLYREVFGLPETDPAVTPKLLCTLQRNGGSAVGAFDATGRLVGFTYGFVGLDGGAPFHHSQAAVVAASAQGHGVGRQLKRAQAEVARDTGVHAMRWIYDPMQARNAHFNLDVLGATGRAFHRNYFQLPDAADRPDRVVVEWPLAPDHRPAGPVAPPLQVPVWGHTREEHGDAWLAVPADWSRLRRTDPGRAAAVRDAVAGQLDRLLDGDRVLLSCRRIDADTALYRVGAGTP